MYVYALLIITLVALCTYVYTYNATEQFNVNRFGKCKREVIDSWSPINPCVAVTDELGKYHRYAVPSNTVHYKMKGTPSNSLIVAPHNAEYSNFYVTPIASADSKRYTSANAVLQGLNSVEPVNEFPFVMDTDKRFYLDSRKEFCKVSNDNASMSCAGQVRNEGFDNVKDVYNTFKMPIFKMPITFHNENTTSFYPIYPFAPMGTNSVTGDKYYIGFPNDTPDGMTFAPYLQK